MKNEKRLIDANAFLESIEGIDWYTIRVDGSATQGAPSEEVAWYKATDIYAAIENAPTVDAEPVVHGRWVAKETVIRSPFAKNYYCSECQTGGSPQWKRCPVCEAKMDGGS